VLQTSKCKRTREVVCANGNNGPGFIVHSILSLYGDDHVLDDKNKYKVLYFSDNYMAAICPKHIVEISIHMCSSVTLERGLPLHQVILLPLLPPDKGCFLHRCCRPMLMPAVTSDITLPTYIILYRKYIS
jgi:hypothetical protein